MGFFSTDRDDDGNARFTASDKWWMFFAVAVQLTLLTFAVVAALGSLSDWRAYRRDAAEKKAAEEDRDDEKRMFGFSW